jgi:pantoate--beta-alanine ligase
MKVVRSAVALQKLLLPLKKKGLRIGFVPTMGALHEGHLSLVRRCRQACDVTVVSIFVNPLQFGPKEDLKKYPRNTTRDIRLLERARADILYLPDEKTFYPPGFQTTVRVSVLSEPLCGRTRPTHFAGVTTVVARLLGIVRPDLLILGQKDFQQYQVVRRMIMDLEWPVKLVMAPIVREKDGLAMSSRNVRLSKTERLEAPKIYRALRLVRQAALKGERSAAQLKKILKRALSAIAGARVDYAEIVDAESLLPVVKLLPNRTYLAAAAVFFSDARLIDNMLLRVK